MIPYCMMILIREIIILRGIFVFLFNSWVGSNWHWLPRFDHVHIQSFSVTFTNLHHIIYI